MIALKFSSTALLTVAMFSETASSSGTAAAISPSTSSVYSFRILRAASSRSALALASLKALNSAISASVILTCRVFSFSLIMFEY